MRKTVYISKSKRGDIDTLLSLRKILAQYDVEVTEFEGGEYTTEKLMNADICILVDPRFNDKEIQLGRGQFKEAWKFVNNLNSYEKISASFAIYQDDNTFKTLDILEGVYLEGAFDHTQVNWSTEWGYIYADKLMYTSELEKMMGIDKIDQWEEAHEIERKHLNNQVSQKVKTKPMLACYKFLK